MKLYAFALLAVFSFSSVAEEVVEDGNYVAGKVSMEAKKKPAKKRIRKHKRLSTVKLHALKQANLKRFEDLEQYLKKELERPAWTDKLLKEKFYGEMILPYKKMNLEYEEIQKIIDLEEEKEGSFEGCTRSLDTITCPEGQYKLQPSIDAKINDSLREAVEEVEAPSTNKPQPSNKKSSDQ